MHLTPNSTPEPPQIATPPFVIHRSGRYCPPPVRRLSTPTQHSLPLGRPALALMLAAAMTSGFVSHAAAQQPTPKAPAPAPAPTRQPDGPKPDAPLTEPDDAATPPTPTGIEPEPIPAELEPFQGRPIRFVTLRHPITEVNPEPFSERIEQLVRNQLRLREGGAFSAELVSEDVARLNRLGRFKRVESRVQLLADGGVELVYILSLQSIVQNVQSVGNSRISDEQIMGMVGNLEGTPVDRTQLDRACRRIEGAYKEKGYYNALVTVDDTELAATGIVLFQVREGERTRVSDIRFEGNNSFHSDEIQSELKTKEAWILERAPVDSDLIADDIGTIIQFYKDRGRLDIRVDRIITPSPNGKEAIVTFVIEEGPVYTLRSVKISASEEDRRVFSPDQLMALMTVKPGDVYADDKIKKAIKLIEDAYGKLGYVDVEVRRREMRDTAEPLVDTVIVITEGRRYLTGEVQIRGNRLTRDDVVRRQVQLQPDRPLDETAVADTERRLRNTGLFAPQPPPKVTIQAEDPENPGYRDVLIEVEETNTGSINVGGAVSSDSGVLATLSVTQRNFDITAPPGSWDELWGGDAFRGGGQTLSVVAQPGTEVRNFSISLSDPTVNDSDFSGSASVFYRERDYSSYTESRIGTKLSVGRRFGTRWNLNVPLRIENVGLDDIDADAPTDYFAVEDDQLVIGLGASISRNTLDDQIRPGSGTVTEFGLEQVSADESFQKLRAEWMGFYTLRQDFFERKTVLNVRTRSEWTPQDPEQVPFYERYYLGGRNFRGFDFRGASPVGIRNDNGEVSDDPVGGTFLFFLGAEVEQPVYEDLLSVVAFVDSGTVTDEPGFDAYRVSVGFGFRIYIPALSQAPLAFDFAVPILKEETDETQNFNFSVDVPFN